MIARVPHDLEEYGGSMITSAVGRDFYRVEGVNSNRAKESLPAVYSIDRAEEVLAEAREKGDSQGRMYDSWYIIRYSPRVHIDIVGGL